MDVKWAAVVLLGAIGTGTTCAAEKIQVDVYVQKDNWPQPMYSSEALAAKIFDRIGVHVTWHAGEMPKSHRVGRQLIGIRIVEHAPISLAPRALASALPYGSSGSLIRIYEDRVQQLLADFSDSGNVLLAYVLAHELAHIMLGYAYHSDSGILKAQWSHADRDAMRVRRLAFTEDDAERIRDGLTIRLSAR